MNTAKEIASAVQKYFAIMKVPHDEEAKAFLLQCLSGSIKIKNNQYDYYQRGEGPVVVLVHGLHSNVCSMVPIAEDLVAQGYKIVLFDAPAHGEAKGMSTNLPQIRQFIQALYQQLGELHAVIGHSLGVMWALSAWNKDFQAKTLISIASPSNPRFLVEKFVALNKIGGEVAEGLFLQLERRFGKGFWLEFSPTEIVKSLDVPGLIIHSQDDEFVPLSHAQEIHSNWEKSNLEIVEGTEHFDLAISSKVRALIADYLQTF